MATKTREKKWTEESAEEIPAGGGAAAVLQVATRLHAMNPDWIVFFREVLGVDGIVRRAFRDPTALVQFECSPQYARVREMLDDLRARQQDRPPERESQRIITVRMPRSLHETLKAEAMDKKVSINTLCISKLLRMLDDGDQKEMEEESGVAETSGTKEQD
jgi:predicted HicB family RNase H-like nuclease